MADINPTELDTTGKVILDQVYQNDTPLAFYNVISQLDYSVPQEAKPSFLALIDDLISEKDGRALKIVDVGCSYGVNAALLKYKLRLEELFAHYEAAFKAGLSRDALLHADHELIKATTARPLEVVGVDISEPALNYASQARFIDAIVAGNFETTPLSAEQSDLIHGAGLIISTGCIGYVSEKTIARLLEAAGPDVPVMAHYVLRTFSFEKIAEIAAGCGLKTLKGIKPIRQRRFASSEEYESALARLKTMGVDPSGFESEGWYYADLYLSLPEARLAQSLPAQLQKLFECG